MRLMGIKHIKVLVKQIIIKNENNNLLKIDEAQKQEEQNKK